MISFAPLRALGWTRPAPPPPVRLADPTGDVVVRQLLEAGLWRDDTNLGLQRDGKRLTLRLFTPEREQSERSAGGERATLAKAVVAAALRDDGYAIRFTDALFYERGTKGWVVLACAMEVR